MVTTQIKSTYYSIEILLFTAISKTIHLLAKL